jgi:hypothetical protein
MSNPRRKKQPPASLSPDILGELPGGPVDSQLKPRPTPPATSGQQRPADEDTLRLPRGGLAAMRRSGGFRFRSRTIVVYRDGRVVYDSADPDAPAGAQETRVLTDAELAELRRLLGQISFSAQPAASGRHNPDAFAYEIVARPARRAYAIEVFEGSIPPQVASLIHQLSQLMRPEQ